MPQAFTRKDSKVVELKLPRRYLAPVQTGDTPHHDCVAQANFCRCWMPAWFHLAELVGEERRSAGA